jgi:hypothetical protein
MKSPLRIFVTALLTIAGMVTSTSANAQPHMLETLDDTTVPTPPDDVWLRRLVGNFKLDGMISAGDCSTGMCAGINGKIDCVAIGDGPGVQCIMNAPWEIYSRLMNLSSFLDPAMSLFGLDPGRKAINLLLINDKGLPTGGFGVVKGHFASFRTMCRGANDDGCEVGIRIEAKPDANINYMWIGEAIVISMRRIPPEDSLPPQKSR